MPAGEASGFVTAFQLDEQCLVSRRVGADEGVALIAEIMVLSLVIRGTDL